MVYVVQDNPKLDLIPAKKFGELSVLLTGGQVMFSPGPVVRELNKKLLQFNDDDYLLCIGDPAAIGVACAVAANHNNGRFKLLKWDRRERDYFPIEINMYQS